MGDFASIGFDYCNEKTQAIDKGSIAAGYSLSSYCLLDAQVAIGSVVLNLFLRVLTLLAVVKLSFAW